MNPRMSKTVDSNHAQPALVVRHRTLPGELNRGAVDALQTKIAVNVQNLDKNRFKEQLQENISELTDASGCDAAFLILFNKGLSCIETVLASSSVFSAWNAAALEGEWLRITLTPLIEKGDILIAQHVLLYFRHRIARQLVSKNNLLRYFVICQAVFTSGN